MQIKDSLVFNGLLIGTTRICRTAKKWKRRQINICSSAELYITRQGYKILNFYTKGYKIKKGMEVYFPLYAIHHNPEIYPEPEVFNPDRFLPENKDKIAPCTFLSFGGGSRQCIGVRFVYEIFKIFMLNVLKEFRIEKRDDTRWKEHPGNPFAIQLDPIYLDFVKR